MEYLIEFRCQHIPGYTHHLFTNSTTMMPVYLRLTQPTMKILPDDVKQVTISKLPLHNQLTIATHIQRNELIWADIASQDNI
jgi:hypothetical protein